MHMKVFPAKICSNMTLEKVPRMTHSNIGRFLCLFAGRDVQAGVYPIVYFIWRIFLSSFIQKLIPERRTYVIGAAFVKRLSDVTR